MSLFSETELVCSEECEPVRLTVEALKGVDPLTTSAGGR
jgi:hypothetical protein